MLKKSPRNLFGAFQEAFRSALLSLVEQYPDKMVSLPYGIGCGIAGGDWNVIQKIIKEVFANNKIIKKRKE